MGGTELYAMFASEDFLKDIKNGSFIVLISTANTILQSYIVTSYATMYIPQCFEGCLPMFEGTP